MANENGKTIAGLFTISVSEKRFESKLKMLGVSNFMIGCILQSTIEDLLSGEVYGIDRVQAIGIIATLKRHLLPMYAQEVERHVSLVLGENIP